MSASNALAILTTNLIFNLLQEFPMALRPLHDRVIVKRLDNER